MDDNDSLMVQVKHVCGHIHDRYVCSYNKETNTYHRVSRFREIDQKNLEVKIRKSYKQRLKVAKKSTKIYWSKKLCVPCYKRVENARRNS